MFYDLRNPDPEALKSVSPQISTLNLNLYAEAAAMTPEDLVFIKLN